MTRLHDLYHQFGQSPWLDNLKPDATIAHAVIVLNGLCATNANLVEMMQYELERAFGRILGLDYSQVNPGALTGAEPGGALGWPVMENGPSVSSLVSLALVITPVLVPVEKNCGDGVPRALCGSSSVQNSWSGP